MSDKPELPDDGTTLLDAAVGELKPKGDVAQIVDLASRRSKKSGEEWRDAVAALKAMVADLESGASAPIVRCAIVLQDEEGNLDVFGIGPQADDLSVVALIGLGLHQIQSEMLY